jgi:hypothetical protein
VYPLGKVKQSLATTLLLVLQEKKMGINPEIDYIIKAEEMQLIE